MSITDEVIPEWWLLKTASNRLRRTLGALMETLHCSGSVLLPGYRKQQSSLRRHETCTGAYISVGSLGATKVFLNPSTNSLLSHAIILDVSSHQK